MAHKTGAGSTKNSKDSNSKRLGMKCAGNQIIKKGSIIIRQRGTRVRAGTNVGCAKDHTLYALKDGILSFTKLSIANIVEFSYL